jgi:RNA polymerase sigma factor (sigma-70 family)
VKPADLARLFADEAPRLLRRLRRFRGQVASEDVVQSAFAKMLEADASEIAEPRAYLARVTMNLAIDEARRAAKAPVTSVRSEDMDGLAGASTDLSADEMLVRGERFAALMGAVLALPEKERLALLWAKQDGLTHREIAERLGESQHNVPFYLSRALAKCRKAMQAFEQAGAHGLDHGGRRADAD